MEVKITKIVCRVLSITMLFLCIATVSQAAIIFETTDFLSGFEGKKYEIPSIESEEFKFLSTETPTGYQVTLSDLSYGKLAFDYLSLSISTSTKTVGYMEGPGKLSFDAAPDTSYFINVFGIGGGKLSTGLYGVQVSAVPVPAALWLFASGLIALISVKRRSL